MNAEIQSLHNVWSANRSASVTDNYQISFNELTNAIVSTGPFSFYIIDFYDMSLSHISDSLFKLHDFDPDTISFNDILGAIHPDDMDFVIEAEDFLTRFFAEKVGRDKLMRYKISYSHRARLKNGNYALFNHQALMLTLDENGGYGKSLNIHTQIDHLSNFPTYKISLIGLHGEPSYMNLNIRGNVGSPVSLSKREIDVIKNIADGLNSAEIADKLFIAESTVKKHRKNILTKSECKNTAQLVKACILQGLI
ncbi:MAG TPA: helix-turn-helix transcriptional regulator [Pedobacter sp.]|nr:helix-turn-helix transcriptional regulator [Pedobacter sp.]